MSLSAVARLPGLGMTYHCPPAGENESVLSLAAPSGSGQRAGTRFLTFTHEERAMLVIALAWVDGEHRPEHERRLLRALTDEGCEALGVE